MVLHKKIDFLKINVKKYLLYSSVFAIFTEGFFYNLIIDWKLFYLIILVNYVIITKYYKTIKINKYLLYIIGFLFIHAVICYAYIGITPNYMLSQILGMSIVGFYFYNFVSLYKIEEIINVYLSIVIVVAIIAYPFYFLDFHPFKHHHTEYRLMSIFKEPAHYAVVVLPACYFYLKKRNYIRFLAVFGTLILTNSTLGYLGCALMFIIPNLSIKRLGYFIATIPVMVGVFYYVYTEYPFLKLRVDDTYETLNSVNTGKFKEHTNLTTYSILSNVFIAKENIIDHPLGTGIGSHFYVYNNMYKKEMRPPQYLRTQNLHNSNSTDANSLFLRMVSELGIFGLILIAFLMYQAAKSFTLNNDQLFLSQGIFIYLLLKLFRDGHYFTPELYFFIWLLYFEINTINKSKESLP